MRLAGELLERRELIWALASKNITVRYKQAYLGIAWALLRPRDADADLHAGLHPFRSVPGRLDVTRIPELGLTQSVIGPSEVSTNDLDQTSESPRCGAAGEALVTCRLPCTR
jgi:hypothetical protein